MSRFVYGSLMAPEVLRALLGRVPDRTAATVRGYRRSGIKDRVYPAMTPSVDAEDALVRGEVIRGLTRRELAVLDRFEDEADDAYVPTTVAAETAEGTENVTAYVWRDLASLDGAWSYESFRENHLEGFVEMCEGFANDAVNGNDAVAKDAMETHESA